MANHQPNGKRDQLPMHILVFADKENQAKAQGLLPCLAHIPVSKSLFSGFNDFFNGLKNLPGVEKIVIYFAHNPAALDDLIKIRAFLEGTKLLLMLPDDTEASITSGLRAFPRFLTSATDDLELVIHMVEKFCSPASNAFP